MSRHPIPSLLRPAVTLALAVGLAMPGCGTPAPAPARTVASGDWVQFYVPPEVLAGARTDALQLLATPRAVADDGSLFVPFVGPVPVVGRTEPDVGSTVSEMMRCVYNAPVQMQARIVNR